MAAGTTAEAEGGVRRRAVPSRRRLAAAVLAGALLGAGAGYGAGQHLGAERSVALIDLSDAITATTGSSPTADLANRFVQTELLYLNSTTFSRAVAAAVPTGTPVALSAAQVGDTDVVQIVATAAAGQDAVRAADGAVGTYDAHRRADLTARASDLTTQLAAARAAQAAASGTDAAALQDRVTALQTQADDARLAATAVGVGGTVVQSAADAGWSATVSATTAIGAGTALGVLLGLLLVVLPRLLSRRVWRADDVAELGVAVLDPPLPAARRGWLAELARRPSSDPLETASRLLVGRLGALAGGDRPVLLTGASAGAGTSFAAVNLATALARRRPTVLVAAGDVVAGRVGTWLGAPAGEPGLADLVHARTVRDVEAALVMTAVPGLHLLPAVPADRWEPVESALPGVVALLLAAGWAVVVDAPPAGRSAAAAELARLRPITAVVATAGRLTAPQVAAAVDAVVAVDAGPPTVLLTAAPGRRARAGERPLPAGPGVARPAVPTPAHAAPAPAR